MLAGAGSSERSSLVGREAELRALIHQLEQSIAGIGSLVLISGEAGIGKTTLVRTLEREAEERGCLVLSGACYDLTTTPPYGPWVEALRGYRPTATLPPMPAWLEQAESPPNAGRQAALFEEACRFFSAIAEHQPLVIILEDLHWCEPVSMEALRYVSRTMANSSVLIVASYRDDPLRHGHPLSEVIPILVREVDAWRISLRRWQLPETRALVASRYKLLAQDEDRLARYLQRLAEGNPFFSVELLLTLEHDRVLRQFDGGWTLDPLSVSRVPPLVRVVVGRRLDELSERSRHLLEIAAVIGQQVSFRLWQEVSGVDTEQLVDATRDAIDASFVNHLPDRSGIQFRHALVREALYVGVIGLRLIDWHTKIAEVLSRQTTPDPDLVAHHFAAAGDSRQFDWLLRAVLRARWSGAWFTAVERLEQAAKLLEGDAARTSDRGWLVFYAANLARYLNDPQLLNAYADEVERLALLSSDRELLANVLQMRGVTRCHSGDLRQGVLDLDRAVATFIELGGERALPLADERLAVLIQQMLPATDDRPDPIQLRLERRSNRPAGMDPRLGIFAHWLAQAGRFREAIAIGERLIAAMEARAASGDTSSDFTEFNYFGLSLANAGFGRPDQARYFMQRGRNGALVNGDYWAASLSAMGELVYVVIPYATDDIAARDQLVSEASAILARAGKLAAPVGTESPAAIFRDLLEGRWHDARRFAQHVADQPHLFVMLHALIEMALASLDHNQGMPDSAWAHILTILPDGPATEPGDCILMTGMKLQQLAAELALDAGKPDLARDWLCAHERWLAWCGAVIGQAEGHLLWARYHLAAGDPPRAGQRAEQALIAASDPRQPLALIAVQRFLGELALRRHDHDTAEKWLSASAQLAERCRTRYELALTQLVWTELALASSDTPRATELLDAALPMLDALAAAPAERRAQSLVARLPGRSSTEEPPRLSARESDVLRLVAQGLTDVQVSERLYISPRTVSQHLRSIYRKLNVTNRTAAVRAALDCGIL